MISSYEAKLSGSEEPISTSGKNLGVFSLSLRVLKLLRVYIFARYLFYLVIFVVELLLQDRKDQKSMCNV